MASYANSSGLLQFSNDGTGFGQGAYDRAKSAGWTDDQIRSALPGSGLTVGNKVAGALGMSSSAASAFSGGGGASLAGSLVNSGLQGLTGLANKYSSNETIGNLAIGSIADTFKTQANMGLDLQYQSAMIGTLADYQYGLENLRAGNAMQLVAAEGAIAKDIAKLNSETALGVGQLQLEGYKYQADKGLEGTKYNADRNLEGSKYVADRNLEGNRYVADRNLEGNKYVADKNYQGVKYTADEATNRVRVQGDEDRKTLGENTLQNLRLRSDARNAVRSAGSRFYS
jgi:hypothetical protein